ncbi:MAG: DEAD/DEAH box helicase, partial [Marivivens sp.]|nr:DEAD/DEAH box helicase [Marivivens sp.]
DICHKSLSKYGYDSAPIHGDLDQSQRNSTLESFREGKIKILVASDVAARGLDVPSVTHVFNFDVPGHPEDYVHRIGRTGRAGRDGKAIMICEPRDEKNFDAVQKLLGKDIPVLENPLGQIEASEDKPEASDDKPKRSRSRRGGARKKDDEVKPQEQVVEAPTPEVVEDVAAIEKPVERDQRPQRDSNRDNNRDRGQRRDRRRDRDDQVIGMGDDAPAFIRLSFDERRKA